MSYQKVYFLINVYSLRKFAKFAKFTANKLRPYVEIACNMRRIMVLFAKQVNYQKVHFMIVGRITCAV